MSESEESKLVQRVRRYEEALQRDAAEAADRGLTSSKAERKSKGIHFFKGSPDKDGCSLCGWSSGDPIHYATGEYLDPDFWER